MRLWNTTLDTPLCLIVELWLLNVDCEKKFANSGPYLTWLAKFWQEMSTLKLNFALKVIQKQLLELSLNVCAGSTFALTV